MFVYVARLIYKGREPLRDQIIVGVAKTQEKARQICERDVKGVEGVTANEEWEKKYGGYWTLYRSDGGYYTISDWVLEGGE